VIIKSAAIKVGKIVYSLPQPARHHDIIREIFLSTGHRIRGSAKQGFVTEDNDFVDREMAFRITGRGRDGKTYSEDLW
jgi:hypothetical protein